MKPKLTTERQRWALDIAYDVLTRIKRLGMRHVVLLTRDGKADIRRWHPTQSEFGDDIVGVYDQNATLIDVAEDLLFASANLKLDPASTTPATVH